MAVRWDVGVPASDGASNRARRMLELDVLEQRSLLDAEQIPVQPVTNESAIQVMTVT